MKRSYSEKESLQPATKNCELIPEQPIEEELVSLEDSNEVRKRHLNKSPASSDNEISVFSEAAFDNFDTPE